MPLRPSARAAVARTAALLVLAACAACAASTSGSAPAPAPAPAPAASLAPAPPELSTAGFGLVRDPALAAALRDISPERIRRVDSTLVAFGTRHILSDTLSSTRGTGAARRWLHAELAAYARDCGGCLRVELDTATMPVDVRRAPQPSMLSVNVLAWLPGRDTTRVVVVGGHYDSCVCRSHSRWEAQADAPGANDDGSGTSAVVELARVFSRHFPRGLDATVIFALYDGEEIALLGSTHLAGRLHAAGYRVTAAFTDDIIGNVTSAGGQTESSAVRIFAPDPDNGPSRELGRYVWALGALYTPGFRVFPVYRLDRVGRGGDHSPFVRRGDAGLRFTEMVENENRQHTPEDRLEFVDFGYIARVARLNAAAVGALAMAPPPPDSVVARREVEHSGGMRWTISWRAAPGAASYEILLRRTWEPMPYAVVPVAAAAGGTPTTATLDVQLDNVWAAVRSVGSNGHRSLAAAFPSPPPSRADSR